jgi:type II secretory pathway pseudopilin PulG
MSFFPQPCLALPESPKLRAKQGHATFRHGSPLLHPLCRRIAQEQDSRALNFHHQKSKIQNPKFGGSAFSLTEVVIAMGVAAVAFTSIIALFPLGLNMSRESYEATQAALIAQTILADLQDEGQGTGALGSSRFIQKGGNSDPTSTANYLSINFNTASTITIYLAYNQIPQASNDTDPSGQPLMLRPCAGVQGAEPSWYTSGSNGVSVLVKVTATPCFRINGSGASSNPMRIDVSVETPGNVTNKSRSQFLFTGCTHPG